MVSDAIPPMQNKDYVRCLAHAVVAMAADEVERLGAEVLRRWAGDPRADYLALALCTYRERLAARAAALEPRTTRATG